MRRGPKLWSASTESQSSGSPPASPATVPSPPAASQKPSFLAQWLQNRREQEPKTDKLLSVQFSCWGKRQFTFQCDTITWPRDTC
ncbi:nucleoporin NDC1-like [Sinocyclocheilus rhinocerous]|uniref:nucleoporin NDC1-like n=1 Tax=Sinocyclocheilus rhinocerous TaxID=307959 RepID=UPI0007B9C1BC|nr:PREDICTED: nucleoporin NDC1-like [Sinocyclocheilus rhinocerous]